MLMYETISKLDNGKIVGLVRISLLEVKSWGMGKNESAKELQRLVRERGIVDITEISEERNCILVFGIVAGCFID